MRAWRPTIGTRRISSMPRGVAKLLGLARRNAVLTYRRRYPTMPRSIIDFGQGRGKLWQLERFMSSER